MMNPECCLTEMICKSWGSLAGVSVPAEGPQNLKLILKGYAFFEMPD